jgi:hypothetical protein
MQIKCQSKNPKVRDYLEHLSVDGRIILKWVLNKEGVMSG